MKRFVDGHEVELAGEAEITSLADRLYVRTADGTHTAVAVRQGDTTLVSYKGRQYRVDRKLPRRRVGRITSGEMRAPMPGLIVDVMLAEGAAVMKGQKILVLEAMKTQQPFNAPFDGVLTKLPAKKGEQVAEGELLALVEAKEDQA